MKPAQQAFDPARYSDGLSLGADGIWEGHTSDPISYPADGNEACFQIEDSSFWFKHRNACILSAIRRLPPTEGGPIFDIGGGNGFVSLGLQRGGFETVLIEPGPSGASNAKRRGVSTVIRATTEGAALRPATLPAIGLFDVIEHIDDDLHFLKSMRRLLKPGGRLYATVPAYHFLWSQEDVAAGHHRRHTRASMRTLCERAGLKIEYDTYFFRALPIPIFLVRTLADRFRKAGSTTRRRDTTPDHQPPAGWSARILDRLLSSEVRAIESGKSMAFGGSCLVVAIAA